MLSARGVERVVGLPDGWTAPEAGPTGAERLAELSAQELGKVAQRYGVATSTPGGRRCKADIVGDLLGHAGFREAEAAAEAAAAAAASGKTRTFRTVGTTLTAGLAEFGARLLLPETEHAAFAGWGSLEPVDMDSSGLPAEEGGEPWAGQMLWGSREAYAVVFDRAHNLEMDKPEDQLHTLRLPTCLDNTPIPPGRTFTDVIANGGLEHTADILSNRPGLQEKLHKVLLAIVRSGRPCRRIFEEAINDKTGLHWPKGLEDTASEEAYEAFRCGGTR